jgi:hypothetical protein
MIPYTTIRGASVIAFLVFKPSIVVDPVGIEPFLPHLHSNPSRIVGKEIKTGSPNGASGSREVLRPAIPLVCVVAFYRCRVSDRMRLVIS